MNHTPTQTDAAFNELVKAFPALKFIDTSWDNDAADSIEIENYKVMQDEGKTPCNKYRVWMPNIEEGPEYNKFCIEEATPENESKFTEFSTLEEVIKYIDEHTQSRKGTFKSYIPRFTDSATGSQFETMERAVKATKESGGMVKSTPIRIYE